MPHENDDEGPSSSSVVQSFVDAVPGATLVCDPDSLAVRAVNERAASLFGHDPDALTLMGITDLGATREAIDGEPVDRKLESGTAAGGSTRFEWTVEPGRGDRRRVEVRAHTATMAGRERLVVVVSDVTGRARAEHELRTQQRLTDAIAATVPGALFHLDANGTLSRWNERLITDAGYSGPELSGRPLTELVTDHDRATVSDALAEVYGSGTVAECEALLVTRSGGQIPFRFTFGPITDGDGDVIGAIGLGEDLTESTLRAERLAVLTRVLRHNFRNDLNVITGFTEQALASVDDPETRTQLERVVDTAARLLRVGETSRKVERLLDERQSSVPLPLSTAVSEAIDSLPDDARSTAEIDVAVPEGVTVSVVERFPEAITELVDNAIRYNDGERPYVRISAAALPSDSWASLVVADDGPGVPPAERAVLTGDENQLDHASGLGLWYVNWIVSASGGSFDISESKHGGSRIELNLKLHDRDGNR
ncbi:PAS domain-containing protein [Halorubrum sp. DTA98]|uniref:PAS domain-containing protein n=1 Tax=Halorubrum sp. DTA98 TaxID=3402163 RepID=UPI003AB01BC8